MVGLVEHRSLPEYPDDALRAGTAGDVILKIIIDETGKIVLGQVVEGDPLLVAASADALRDFAYRPYQLNGAPIRVETQVGFHFGIEGRGDKAKGEVAYLSAIPFREEFRTGVLNAAGVFDLAPRKVSGAEPQLPPELAGIAGSVYLVETVGEDGKVQDVKVVGGDKRLADVVIAAVKQFVYEPRLVDGKSAVATIQASYHFGTRP